MAAAAAQVEGFISLHYTRSSTCQAAAPGLMLAEDGVAVESQLMVGSMLHYSRPD